MKNDYLINKFLMLNAYNRDLIFNDIWKKVSYEYKSWQDYDIAIVNNRTVYRFPKNKIDEEVLILEKKILDIVKDNRSITVLNLEIIYSFPKIVLTLL